MAFTLEQTVWIGLADGTRLAATLWRPEGEGPFPAVLEYLPYRRGDGTAQRDDSTYPAFAEAGIVGVRVDSRGQGDSEGLFDDEYSPQELADACEVIAWIAAQDWSNGSVGMMGISWGGFNALQVAAMRPPALNAVISIASTADRYADDIHYKGGCLLGANTYWAGTMLSYASRPPDPEVVGDDWLAIWKARLADAPFLLETWLGHQRRDEYWKHGSICEDWSAIECPVWVIAGWADGYRNCPATLARHLMAPVKATTGPWIHKYPHFAWPHPRMDFLGMATNWWRQWLAGEARGVEDWPDHAAYVLEGVRPAKRRDADPGRWVSVAPDAEGGTTLTLGADGVLGSGAPGEVTVASPGHCGTASGEYFTLAPDADLAGDQRADDALSACWTTGALEAPLQIVGRPVLTMPVAIDRPQGNLIARLVDVHPDGTAALIARGVLNLCHRGGNAQPRAMEPGRAETVEVRLDETACRVAPGHRLRLAVSTAYWPMIQPSPEPVVATIAAGPEAVLSLPCPDDLQDIEVPEPPEDTLPDYPVVERGLSRRRVVHDLSTGRVRYVIAHDTGLAEVPRNGMQMRETRDEVWEIDPDDPASSTGRLTFGALRQRGDWRARTEAQVRFSCTAETFDVTAELVAWHGEEEIARRNWSFTVPRDHV